MERFVQKKDVELESNPKVEWDGRDFRKEKCRPGVIRFVRQHPTVFEWLKKRPRNSIQMCSNAIKELCLFLGLTPEQFIKLDKKTARNKTWEYLSSISMDHAGKAQLNKALVQSFYFFHAEEKMAFIPGKHDIVYEPKRIKKRMSKQICWKIIQKTKDLRDETILVFAFQSGLRQNAVSHLTFGHYKNFMWFKKTESGEVVKSNEKEGNIAIFKVMAKKTKQFTHDNKLRGRGIHWYYGCLHKEATKNLKEYVAQYHVGSEDHIGLFYSLKPVDKNRSLVQHRYYDIVKDCVKRASLPVDQINFHSLRRGFRSVVRNTSGITDNEFKEAIMGHKLKGSQENYFDKNPLEFAKQYAKCDFSQPYEEKDNEIERLHHEIKVLTRAQHRETMIHTITPASPELNKQFNEFNDILEQREQYEKDMQGKNTQETPIKKTKNPSSVLTSLEDDLVCCPDQDKYVLQSVECEKCKTENVKRHKECYAERTKNPFGPLFKCSKQKPNFN